jgi:Domain of unknown function (DUF4331)
MGFIKNRTVGFAVLVAAAAAAVLAVGLVQRSAPAPARAADHLDAPGLTPPGGSVQTDITDLYAFQSPASAANSVLVLNVNGVIGGNLTFAQGVPGVKHTLPISYRINVDNNGDAKPDVTLKVRFGAPDANGVQHFEVKRGHEVLIPMGLGQSTGFNAASPTIVTHSGVTAFAGRRDDPFFFDLAAFRNGLQFCPGGQGTDFFLGKNVSSIVLELPSRMLTRGHDPNIGVWAVTQAGKTQIDRMGRPAINTVFMHGDRKNQFNAGVPADDQRDFRGDVVDTLLSLGNSQARADALANVLLPDVLTFDTSSSAGFLNGRKLTDDVIDAELNLITNGAVTGDCVANDSTFLSSFPYVGNPN